MGLAAGEFAKRNPGPMLPADTARDASRIDLASAIGGDNLRFKVDPSLVKAAQGGRIGYKKGTRNKGYLDYVQAMNALGQTPMPIGIYNSLSTHMTRLGYATSFALDTISIL